MQNKELTDYILDNLDQRDKTEIVFALSEMNDEGRIIALHRNKLQLRRVKFNRELGIHHITFDDGSCWEPDMTIVFLQGSLRLFLQGSLRWFLEENSHEVLEPSTGGMDSCL